MPQKKIGDKIEWNESGERRSGTLVRLGEDDVFLTPDDATLPVSAPTCVFRKRPLTYALPRIDFDGDYQFIS